MKTIPAILFIAALSACEAQSGRVDEKACRFSVPPGWLTATEPELRQVIDASYAADGFVWGRRATTLLEIEKNLEILKSFNPPPYVLVHARLSECEESQSLIATVAESGYCADFNCGLTVER